LLGLPQALALLARLARSFAKLALIYAENGRGKTTPIALDSEWLRIR
jgi:hypothetical protein